MIAIDRKILIFIILIVAVAACILTVQLLTRSNEAPEYSYPDSIDASLFYASETDSGSHSSHVSTESSAEPEDTADATPESPAATGREVMLTSHDPRHYFKISLAEDTIYIDGVYDGDTVTVVSASGTASAPVYNGEHITAELQVNAEDRFLHLEIEFLSGAVIKYRLRSEDGRLSLIDSRETAEQSTLAASSPLDIPESAVRDYIVTDGSDQDIAEVLTEVQNISDRICEGLDNDYDKARALATWVSQNFYYDYVARDSGVTTEVLSIARTLELRRSVCGGYANLYAALCQAQGITCYVMQGTVVQNNLTFAEQQDNAPSHEWNMAIIDGRRVWVDTLWNTGNIYTARSGYVDGYLTSRYFDITDEVMALNHRAQRCEIRDYFAVIE